MLVTQAGGEILFRIASAAPQGRIFTIETLVQLCVILWNGMTPAAKEACVARPTRAIKIKVVSALAATAENANLPLLVPASFAD